MNAADFNVASLLFARARSSLLFFFHELHEDVSRVLLVILILLLEGLGPALLIIVFDALEHAKYLFKLGLVG